ncbi:winged helix-turn-helix transcriptional regulator [Streptomyces sp. NPDC048018]|uniref:winged helix-turn-helix transcriptional regulator n=1 Tax=Streptomyces sp. NPDC048018 TaxID=3365499 RepID=UPI00370FB002
MRSDRDDPDAPQGVRGAARHQGREGAPGADRVQGGGPEHEELGAQVPYQRLGAGTGRGHDPESRAAASCTAYPPTAPAAPVRVDYALTPLGASLLPVVRAVKEWADGHIEEVFSAREAYDRGADPF